jgi:hypothetical protein
MSIDIEIENSGRKSYVSLTSTHEESREAERVSHATPHHTTALHCIALHCLIIPIKSITRIVKQYIYYYTTTSVALYYIKYSTVQYIIIII